MPEMHAQKCMLAINRVLRGVGVESNRAFSVLPSFNFLLVARRDSGL